MAITFFNRNIPDECHQKMQQFAAAGDDVVWVAFPPGGGNSWSIVTRSGAFFNRNIPDECHQKMQELSSGGAKIVRVAFPPQGGNSWSVVNDRGGYFNRNIPDECHEKMKELSQNGARIVSVAFPPQGGNSWSLVNSQGAYFNRNIPEECHQMMGTLSAGGAKITCVAFPRTGGNSWTVVNDRGAFFNRNVPDEAHMYMEYFTEVSGPVTVAAYGASADSWSVVSTVTKAEKVCDAKTCVAVADVYRNIQQALDGKVVGYACCVGAGSIGAYSHGYARTAANAPAQLFLPSTKITVASVSKVVTALAAIRVLGKHQIPLTAGIGPYLPSDWTVAPYVKSISFAQLLSHTSGIKDYGNWGNDDAGLKQFFTQPVDPSKNTSCQGPDKVQVPYAINPNDKSPCYSNFNFAIFRVLLPVIEGVSADPAGRAERLAQAYVRIVQQNVFEPVGAFGVDTKPPAEGPQAGAYAFAYSYPGTQPGFDWGDNTLSAGAAGWYLSIDDISRVLFSLNRRDGRILSQQQQNDMEALQLPGNVTVHLGWDAGPQDGAGNRWYEKNGGWGAGGDREVNTTIALFGGGLYGAIFCNSKYDVAGTLHDAFVKAQKPKV